MKTKTDAGAKNHGAFTGILGALKAVYEAEIERLADAYRTRILAGEFSGDVTPGGDSKHRELEDEIEAVHPWPRDVALGRAVLAVSPWAFGTESTVTPGSGLEVSLFGAALAGEVAECMAHDVLALAVARGWVKSYRRLGPSYVLRVA
jgi:hypothetical protein